MSKIYQYFVEGECEEKFINSFKVAPINKVLSGKVEVFNFINNKISNQRIAVLKRNTIIILVYDIDVEKSQVLEENIKKLNKYGFKNIIHIQSIKNFEDELVYSTKLNNINDMFNTEGKDEFKKAFIKQKDIVNKLEKVEFDINKIWSRVNSKEPFSKYSNQKDLKTIKTI